MVYCEERMSYGIEVRNSDGNIIIDDKYKNFQVVAYGTVQPNQTIPYSSAAVQNGGLVFGKPSNVNQNDTAGFHIACTPNIFGGATTVATIVDPVQERPNPFSGNTQTYDYRNTPITNPNVGKMAPAVDWVYVQPSVTGSSSPDYGLEVYAADGTVSYTSSIDDSFDIVSTTEISQLGPSSQYDEDYHAVGSVQLNLSTGETPFDYYVLLGNFLSLPITSIPGWWGWVNTAKWTASSLTVYQPTWNISNFTSVAQQFVVGKYAGDANSGQSGGTTTNNAAPNYISGVSSSYVLYSESSIIISPVFSDPEGDAITLSYAVTSGTQGGATIQQSGSLGENFEISPGSTDANFTLAIYANDGQSTTTRTTNISYTVPTGSPPTIGGINSSYSMVGNNSTITISPLTSDSDGDTPITISASVTSGDSTGLFIQMNTQNTQITISWNGASSTRSFQLSIYAVDSSGSASSTVTTTISYTPQSGPGGPGGPGGPPSGGGLDP